MKKWHQHKFEGGVAVIIGSPASMARKSVLANHEGRKYYRRLYEQRRVANLMFFGGKCEHCGINDMRVLQFDHKMACGNKSERRLNVSSRRMLAKLFSDPNEYQLLCANCNWIKRLENDEIPVMELQHARS